LEAIREDEEVVLYRGRGDGELAAILVLAPISEHPSLGCLQRLDHEYSLRNELDPDWAARPLALMRRKGRLMLALAEEHLLEFEPRESIWRWDLNQIQTKGFTDNVVELMVGKLKRLTVSSQEALK
jgi:hypothetical protein